MRSFFDRKKILITGGLGFIGSNLARRLVDWGGRVTLVDSLIPEYGGNLYNIKDFKERVTVNISDVRDRYSLEVLLQGQDFLFNLAGQTSHLDSMLDPYTDLEINCRAQLSILEACRSVNPLIKVIFASTRQVYGIPRYLPVDEKHPLYPVDVNGINKMAGEWYHIVYNNVYRIRTTVLRLTNTYGPRMRIKDARQTFLGIWIRRIIAGDPFEIYGDGTQVRDFNFIDDVIDAFLLAAIREEANGRIYNLGADDPVNLIDLAKLLTQVRGSGTYRVVPFPPERKVIDIGDYYASYAAVQKDLGWKPKTSLGAGLRKTLEYFTQHVTHYL